MYFHLIFHIVPGNHLEKNSQLDFDVTHILGPEKVTGSVSFM